MLTREDNDRLCRTGPGTPMGNLFRRFWIPALLSCEIAAPDSPPKRLRILGEDLVAFRDSAGKVGVIDAYCPHRGAQLFWGRNEECGLRCPYHGWKFDVNGHCADLPNIQEGDATRDKISVIAYPAKEAGGMVWIYMGPPDKMPPLPAMEWTSLPVENLHVTRWLQCTNWFQGLEGEIDSSHVSFLHRALDAEHDLPPQFTSYGPPGPVDGAPKLTLKETPYGFVTGSRRRTVNEGEYFWRVTHWLAPMFSLIANHRYPRSGRAWVPVDDNHVMTFGYIFNAERAMTEEENSILDKGSFFPPRIVPGVHTLPDGYMIDTFLPQAHRGNDFLIDRAMQRTGNYTGIYGVNEQDRCIQESQRSVPGVRPGGFADRSRERLVASDVAVVTARRRLLRMIKELENGEEPEQPQHPQSYNVRAIAAVSRHDAFDNFFEEQRHEIELP